MVVSGGLLSLVGRFNLRTCDCFNLVILLVNVHVFNGKLCLIGFCVVPPDAFEMDGNRDEVDLNETNYRTI